MAKLDQQISALREAMRNADGRDSDSFNAVFSRFLRITERTELVQVSKPCQDRRVRFLLENVARQHARDKAAKLDGLHMLQHAGSGLVHGMFFLGPQPGSFFMFREDQQGIVALVENLSVMHYYRITATEVPAGSFMARRDRWKN